MATPPLLATQFASRPITVNSRTKPPSKTTRSVESTTDDDDDTTAEVTLDCSEKSAAKVGTATVSASVDRASDSDVYAEDHRRYAGW